MQRAYVSTMSEESTAEIGLMYQKRSNYDLFRNFLGQQF